MMLAHDLRQAVRGMRSSPGATLTAVAALAIGIGANTAIFSVVDAVLLRPLPFAEPDRLFMVWQNDTNRHTEREWVSPANFLDWRRDSRAFSSLAAFSESGFNLTGSGEPERLDGQRVSASLFPLLGVGAALGRSFLSEEDQAGAARVVILSDGLWRRRFGADPAIVGRSILLDGESVAVVGVMPPRFRFPGEEDDLWVPLAFDGKEAARRRSLMLRVVGRLAPGVTAGEARAEMETIARRLERAYPEANAGMGATLVGLQDQMVGDARAALYVLLAAVGAVLLIACANVASILMTRAAARGRDLAIRAALGASRARLVRQLLTESVLLALLGGALGILLALWGIDVLQAGIPADIPRFSRIGLDPRVLVFTLGVSLLTGLLFGVLPALGASRPDLNEALRDGVRGTSGPARSRARAALVVAEVALALVLLIGAGLLIRSFANVRGLNPGFLPENLLTLRMDLPEKKYGDLGARSAFYREILDRVGGIPGVRDAGLVTFLPLTFVGGSFAFQVEGRPIPPAGQEPFTVYRVVSPGLFGAMGIPLLRGRTFTDADDVRTPLVAIIGDTMARQVFPGQDPVGRRILFGVGPQGPDAQWVTIVGVAGDVRQFDLDSDPRPAVYVPYAQETLFWFAPRDLVVRAAGTEPLALAAAVRATIRSVDPNQPISSVRTMDDVVSEASARRRFSALLLGVFAAAALILAAVGVYGVVACSVEQRTREIGIRMALGARRRQVFGLVVGQAARLALLGVALGLAGSLALTRLLGSLLFGVTPTDPLTFVLTALVLPTCAVVACLVPARRATRLDPMVALRCD
jgi:putative ABC transport system permease protein